MYKNICKRICIYIYIAYFTSAPYPLSSYILASGGTCVRAHVYVVYMYMCGCGSAHICPYVSVQMQRYTCVYMSVCVKDTRVCT